MAAATTLMFDSSMYEDAHRMRLSPTTAAKRKHELTLDVRGQFQTASKRQRNHGLVSEEDGSATLFGMQGELEFSTPEFNRLLMNPLLSDVDLQSCSTSSSYNSPVAAGFIADVRQQHKPTTAGLVAPVPSVVEALAEQDDDPQPSMTGGRRQQPRRNGDAATIAISSLPSRVESSSSLSNLSADSCSRRQPSIFQSLHPTSYVTHAPSVVDRWIDEPQIVPDFRGGSVGDHELKVEKKRERNRLAAQKCRLRKVQQIDSLQARVDELKEKNTTLEQAAEALRQEVTTLRHHFSLHLNSGCRLMPATSSSGQSRVDFFP